MPTDVKKFEGFKRMPNSAQRMPASQAAQQEHTSCATEGAAA